MPKNYADTEDLYKPAVVDKPKASYNLGTKSVQSIFPAHLKYEGLVTGKSYEWFRSGDVAVVDDADVADLLAKRVGAVGCCGNSPGGNIVFQLI